MISIYMPEFHGDVLWSVPAMRGLAARHGCKADILLGPKGARTADLLSHQSFVNTVVPDSTHLAVADYSLTFREGRHDETLLDYFCRLADLPRQGHFFEIPELDEYVAIPWDYFVVVAPKKEDGWMNSCWGSMWTQFVKKCPLPVIEVGRPDINAKAEEGAIDGRYIGFLEMAYIISRCRYFFGHISAPLVLADAMPDVVRVAVHDGTSWNLRACTHSPMNHYPVCYDADTLLRYIA